MITEYVLPDSAEAAAARIGAGAAVMAGGTVVLPRGVEADRVVGLARAGLDAIERRDGRTILGATATLAAVALLDGIVARAAAAVGGPALRNMATVGGNLLAGLPYGDLGVPLLALGAEVELVGLAGPDDSAGDDLVGRAGPHDAVGDELVARTIPIESLWDTFRPGELIRAVSYDDAPGVYLRWARRAANSPAVVSVAVSGGRVALGGVAPHPVRSPAAEGLIGDPAAAGDAAAAVVDPPTDGIASSWYRRRMTRVFVRRALEESHGV
jgi:CO/xanthine dehydrogenase FAD-binding subunit